MQNIVLVIFFALIAIYTLCTTPTELAALGVVATLSVTLLAILTLGIILIRQQNRDQDEAFDEYEVNGVQVFVSVGAVVEETDDGALLITGQLESETDEDETLPA